MANTTSLSKAEKIAECIAICKNSPERRARKGKGPIPKAGPALQFCPEDSVKFEAAQQNEHSGPYLSTVAVTNRCSRIVNIRFTRDPEFKFCPAEIFLDSGETSRISITFYNDDGNCRPRKSSIMLRAIRVRNREPLDVQKLWLSTRARVIRRKWWKITFPPPPPPPTHPLNAGEAGVRVITSEENELEDLGKRPSIEEDDLVLQCDSTNMVHKELQIQSIQIDVSDHKQGMIDNSPQCKDVIALDHSSDLTHITEVIFVQPLFWLGLVAAVVALWHCGYVVSRTASRPVPILPDECFEENGKTYCL
ncbi:uncharacterized protein LOC135400817 [Ornithodoros turicata]|uniref:uncharacterized protein LOC135400817 n=1 Tax=Ornithodoros turicata TaxID=34597 RepID=UPI00313994C7